MEISSPAISGYFSSISNLLGGMTGSSPNPSVVLFLSLLLFFILLAIIFSIAAYMLGWIERKLLARMQSRRGPTYIGKYGLLQNFADLIKLISKEAVIPDRADKLLFPLVLPVVVAGFVLMLTFLPFTGSFIGINTSLGLFAVFVLLSVMPILLFLAGWTSGNKFASISAQRSVMIMVSYEIPMFIVMASIAMLSGGFGFLSVVSSQASGLWYVLRMPIGFIVFFIVLLAELERPPFDLREADNELIAGWLTDVSPPYYALSLLLDYMRLFTGSLLVSILFLGGWTGIPFLPGFVTLMIKVLAVSVFIMIIRATTFRMRIDKVVKLGWYYLTPLAVLNLLLTFIIFVR